MPPSDSKGNKPATRSWKSKAEGFRRDYGTELYKSPEKAKVRRSHPQDILATEIQAKNKARFENQVLSLGDIAEEHKKLEKALDIFDDFLEAEGTYFIPELEGEKERVGMSCYNAKARH